MLTTTRDMVLPTAITGSYPRPLWYNANLNGGSFKSAMGDSLFRGQYLDAGAAIIHAQEPAGLDLLRASTAQTPARRTRRPRRRRLPRHPGGGAAPSRADDLARLQ